MPYDNPDKVARGVTTMGEIRRVRKRGEKQILTTPVVQEETDSQVVISKEETESEEESQNQLARERIRKNQGTFTTHCQGHQ